MNRSDTVITRHWEKARACREEVLLGVVFAAAVLAFNVYRIQGDGWAYVAFLEKALAIPDPESPQALMRWGYVQMGAAFFNMPFYLAAYGIEKLTGFGIHINGITLRSISINLASNCYVLIAVVLMARTLKQLQFPNILLSILAVLFSTSAYTAAAIMPSCSHAVELFLASAVVYIIVADTGSTRSNYVLMGTLLALSVFVRYFNVVLVACVALYFIKRRDWSPLKYAVLGFFSVIWLLPLLFYTYNGEFFNVMGYTEDHRSISLFLTTVPVFPVNSLKLLVHPLHGVFVWSPVVFLSLLGLFLHPVKADLGFLLLAMFAGIVFMYGFLPEWHAGWSFSNRYLTGLFPVFVIGLASFLKHTGLSARVAATVMTLYSAFLFFNWLLTVIHGDWGTPLDMVHAWANGESPVFLGGELDVNTFFRRLADACRYKHLLKWI